MFGIAVTDVLYDCAKDFICFPNVDGQKRNQLRFREKYGFPKVLGCVDGSHIPIVAPSTNEPLYVNRKGYHSINVQAICDADFALSILLSSGREVLMTHSFGGNPASTE